MAHEFDITQPGENEPVKTPEQIRSEQDAARNHERALERQRQLSWLNEKWSGDHKCPICQNANWDISDVQELRMFGRGVLTIGGPLVPIIGAMCTICGYTHWFNALVSRTVLPQDQPSQDTA